MAKNNNISPDSIIADIKAGKIAPVYFLQGEEPFFIDQVADFIEKNILQEQERGFNQTIIYGKDTDISSIITAAKRFPMMAERQVVIVKEAQDVKDLDKNVKSKVGGKEIEFNALEEYAKNPLLSTVLVLCYKYKTLDARKTLSKSLEEKSIVFTSKGFYENQLPAWIQKLAVSKGHDIQEKASLLLTEFIGNNLSRLSNEMDKILINFKEKTTITDAHVLQYVGVSKEYNVFELQNALSRKDILKCNRIINFFAENPKDNPIQQIIANLYGYFSKILLVKVARPNNDTEVGQLLGMHPFLAKEFLMAARNYNDSKILQSFSYIREADMRSKGYQNNNMDEGEILKELIFKVLH